MCTRGCCRRFASMNRLRHLTGSTPFPVRIVWMIFLILALVLAALWIFWEAERFADAGTVEIVSENYSDEKKDVLMPLWHLHNVNRIRKSFLLSLDLLDDDEPKEKEMFYREYVNGFQNNNKNNKNNESKELTDSDLKSLMRVKLKMTQMLLEEFKYLKEAAHGCKDETVLGVRGGGTARSSKGKEEEEGAIKISYMEEKVGCSLRLIPGSRFNPATLILDVETWDYDHLHDNIVKPAGIELRASDAASGESRVAESKDSSLLLIPGRFYKAQVDPVEHEAAKEVLDRLDLTARGCYSKEEDSNGRHSNCNEESRLKETVGECGCTPPFVPKTSTSPPCHGEGLGCFRKLWMGIDQDNCIQRCDRVEYKLDNVQHYPIKNDNANSLNCIVLQKLINVCTDDIRKEALEESYPDICEKVEDLEDDEDVCGDESTLSATQELKDQLQSYAESNIIVLSLFKDHVNDKKMLLVSEYPAFEFGFKILLILVIVLGFNVLGIFEVLVQCLVALLGGGRRGKGAVGEGEEAESSGGDAGTENDEEV